MSNEQYRPQSFKVLPLVVKNLLIINVLFYLATLIFERTQNIDLANYLGLHYFSSELFKPFQFVTYMFMHATKDASGSFDITHILFNMFALWMFGNVLENYWGSKRFLIFYIITGVGAAAVYLGYQAFQQHQVQEAVTYLTNNPSPENYISLLQNRFGFFYEQPEFQQQVQAFATDWSHHLSAPGYLTVALNDIHQLQSYGINEPMVGASGAIFGILLAYGMLFPNTLLYVYFLIPIKAKYFVIIYGAIELFMGIRNSPGDNVAHFAHLGGMLFGFIMIKYWQRNSKHFY